MFPPEYGSLHPSCVSCPGVRGMAAYVSDKYELVLPWEEELVFTVTLHPRQNTLESA